MRWYRTNWLRTTIRSTDDRVKYKYVYVAGPITKGDTLRNIRKGMLVGIELIKRGYVPFVPHNDMVQYLLDPDTLDYETILQQDLAWVKKCDALLRIPGESPGADREVQYALSQGLLVTHHIDYLEEANGRGA